MRLAFPKPSPTQQRSLVLASRARHIGFTPTPSEKALWQMLRGRRLGVQFRRQVLIGRYIVDFCAPAVRLIIELDGGYHARRSGADARRDAVLGRTGHVVLRLDARLVLQEQSVALARVNRAFDMLAR